MRHLQKKHFLAIDLGASNGRIVHGIFDDSSLKTEVLYRFDHSPLINKNKLIWNWPKITSHIKEGIFNSVERISQPIYAISCDSWAQDFGLLDSDGNIFYSPVSYRDSRTKGLPGEFSNLISNEDLIRRTGAVISPVTALCQLYAMTKTENFILERASQLLFVSDLVHYILSGVKCTDWTMASISQMYSCFYDMWDESLLMKLSIKNNILPKVNNFPTTVGTLQFDFKTNKYLSDTQVVVGANHDSAAAVASIGDRINNDLIICLGTWLMVGCAVENYGDNVTPNIIRMGLPFKKEGIFRGGNGLWLLQQCMGIWKYQHKLDYQVIAKQASNSSIKTIIDTDAISANSLPNIFDAINFLCKDKGQMPASVGDYAKVIFESIAFKIKEYVEELEQYAKRRFKKAYIVGGGNRNEYLVNAIAKNIGIKVFIGPSEGSSIGNLLLQALACGVIKSENQASQLLDCSFNWLEVGR